MGLIEARAFSLCPLKGYKRLRELNALECMLTVDWSNQRITCTRIPEIYTTYLLDSLKKKGTGKTVIFHQSSTWNVINKDVICKFAG